MQQKMTAAITRAAPISDPITIPAIAPPESPCFELCPPDAPPAVEVGEADEVLVGKTGGMEMVVGRSTFWQRASTLALTQHVSVELVVLPAQNKHSPSRLFWKPHSVGSFFTASMQVVLRASAGLEQRAKSERIWGTALLPGVPQSSGLDIITCSLMANSA